MKIVNKKSMIILCALLSACVLSPVLCACGGNGRAKSIPTEKEALEAAEKEFGIQDAQVLDVRDVRNEGGEYYDPTLFRHDTSLSSRPSV